LAKLPWRRWYQWSVFFRRSALWHCASIQNKIAEDWMAVYPDNPEQTSSGGLRPLNVLATGEIIKLSVPKYADDHGVTRGLTLTGSNGRSYFVSELYEIDAIEEPLDPNAPVAAHVAAAHSPLFWFLEYAESEVHGTGGSSLLRRWKEIWDVRRFRALLTERGFMSDMLLGGTTEITAWRFNGVYASDFTNYCTWYARRFQSQSAVAVFTANEGFSFLGEATSEGLTGVGGVLYRTLPPYPTADGVWFVGESPHNISTQQSAVELPLCVGCDTTAELTIRCKTCKQQYCGHACFQSNWRKACGDCVRGK
jgi:hypothetical protein